MCRYGRWWIWRLHRLWKIQWDSIKKCISAARKSNLNRVGFYVSYTREKTVQDLALWVNDSLRIGRVKSEADFDETELTTIKMTEMDDEDYIQLLDWKTNSDVSTTDKFSYNKCDILEDTVGNRINNKEESPTPLYTMSLTRILIH